MQADTKSKESQIAQLEKKVKSLIDTVSELGTRNTTASVACGRDTTDEAIKKELSTAAPILAMFLNVYDRATLAQKLAVVEVYKPSESVRKYLRESLDFEVAMDLPTLHEK